MPVCQSCGSSSMEREALPRYHYLESGLGNVFLADVERLSCAACGESRVRIPNVLGLHRALAIYLTRRPGRLNGPEIRFLRKFLGRSQQDAAALVGVRPETFSRWENDREPIGPQADRLLRLFVRAHDAAAPIVYDDMASLSERERCEGAVEFRRDDDGWSVAA